MSGGVHWRRPGSVGYGISRREPRPCRSKVAGAQMTFYGFDLSAAIEPYILQVIFGVFCHEKSRDPGGIGRRSQFGGLGLVVWLECLKGH